MCLQWAEKASAPFSLLKFQFEYVKKYSCTQTSGRALLTLKINGFFFLICPKSQQKAQCLKQVEADIQNWETITPTAFFYIKNSSLYLHKVNLAVKTLYPADSLLENIRLQMNIFNVENISLRAICPFYFLKWLIHYCVSFRCRQMFSYIYMYTHQL